MTIEKVAKADIGDKVMDFEPAVLTDEFEAIAYLIFQFCRGIYEVSMAGRTDAWHSCPFARIAGAAQ
jgi:hypothetical protein